MAKRLREILNETSYVDESLRSWFHHVNPNRLENDAQKAKEIALKRQTPTSVRRALNLKAAKIAKDVGDEYDKDERISKAANHKNKKVSGTGGIWGLPSKFYKYADAADAIKDN